MSKARALKASRPFMVPLASMSRRTSSKPFSSDLRSAWRSALTPPAKRRSAMPGPSAVNGRWATPEVARLGADAHAAQADERRHVGGSAAQLGHHGAEGRVMGSAVLVLAVAGHDQRVGVLVHRAEGADDGQLVPHAGLQGEVLADLDAGHVGGDRLELAAELLGRVRLEIVHVHVRRAAAEVDHDGRLAGRRFAGGDLAGAARSIPARDRPAPKAPIWRK